MSAVLDATKELSDVISGKDSNLLANLVRGAFKLAGSADVMPLINGLKREYDEKSSGNVLYDANGNVLNTPFAFIQAVIQGDGNYKVASLEVVSSAIAIDPSVQDRQSAHQYAQQVSSDAYVVEMLKLL
jgi:hypothetical protein